MKLTLVYRGIASPRHDKREPTGGGTSGLTVHLNKVHCIEIVSVSLRLDKIEILPDDGRFYIITSRPENKLLALCA